MKLGRSYVPLSQSLNTNTQHRQLISCLFSMKTKTDDCGNVIYNTDNWRV